MSNTKLGTATPVDLVKAASETQAWRAFMSDMPNQDQVNAYFIPIEDITSILQYAATGIRTYFALRTDANGLNQQLHMYVVPVDVNGNDVIFNPSAQGETLIYDTTLPCPSACGGPNQLNGGSQ